MTNRILSLFLLGIGAVADAQTVDFAAQGPVSEKRLPSTELTGAVTVSFDLVPTTMSFDLPWHFCTVSENGIKVAHFAAETYDPRRWDGKGADASFEAGMDKEGRFARVWIEHQSPARIVVRVRYALVNSKGQFARQDVATGSPYNDGNGEWGEERFTIYPDGTFVRHMRIHTALAAMSQPFGFFREPPNVVHEFMETVVIGPPGHVPTDDISTEPTLTLFKMFDAKPGRVFPKGTAKQISYAMPEGPPSDFGEFRDANIMLLHTNSKFQHFTIGLPYGVQVQPYGWEDNREFPFTTWTGYDDRSIGYVSAIGHLINHWHFRRTEKTIEQVYLHGMTVHNGTHDKILNLAWSWIAPPELQMPNVKKSPNDSAGEYNNFTFDQTQKAYVVPRTVPGAERIAFTLDAIYDDEYLHGTMWLVNPAFVVNDWNDSQTPFRVELDGNQLTSGVDYRFGFEPTKSGKNLVIWLNKTIDLNDREEHSAKFAIIPEPTR
ncbi:MAG: hypothetical protein JNK57_19170 [Planctomycetaceae bacterium]|nr:hypothetical protein [Planctomycetaceae bacterium]